MQQKMIPCFFMRGGTSRGPFFLKQHLPTDQETLDKVLLQVMGSPDVCQIDGLGGATTTTSKVAILSVSEEPNVDIDYQFAQIGITEDVVDWGPSCGNMLAGVGPAAIEMGLVKNVGEVETKVKIRAVNNGSYAVVVVQTPGKQVAYDGDVSIDGVPGTSAPIYLNFMDVVGLCTGGKLLPTGRLKDVINGVEVTCIDCGMPIVIARASAMGKTGYETTAQLNMDPDFFVHLEAICRIAGRMMGLGEVSCSVIPKFAIVAEPSVHGVALGTNLTARYFVPTATHATIAVTGGISISCCSILKGTVVDEVSVKTMVGRNKHRIIIEHPSGTTKFLLDAEQRDGDMGMEVHSAGIMRTARLLFTGMVQVPNQVLENAEEAEDVQKLEKDFQQLFSTGEVHLQARKPLLQKQDFKVVPQALPRASLGLLWPAQHHSWKLALRMHVQAATDLRPFHSMYKTAFAGVW